MGRLVGEWAEQVDCGGVGDGRTTKKTLLKVATVAMHLEDLRHVSLTWRDIYTYIATIYLVLYVGPLSQP